MGQVLKLRSLDCFRLCSFTIIMSCENNLLWPCGCHCILSIYRDLFWHFGVNMMIGPADSGLASTYR